jgi:uncharacterized protein with HEPN domain
MKHPERTEDYLQHIVEAIDRATRYLKPLSSVKAFEKNSQIQDAVIRNIEIIGEAARQIQQQAPAFIKAHPELPWLEMRNMRNKVIHAYFDIELPVVWSTIKNDLPKLKQQIDRLLRELKRGPQQ